MFGMCAYASNINGQSEQRSPVDQKAGGQLEKVRKAVKASPLAAISHLIANRGEGGVAMRARRLRQPPASV